MGIRTRSNTQPGRTSAAIGAPAGQAGAPNMSRRGRDRELIGAEFGVYVPRTGVGDATLDSVSQTSRGPANRNRTRPSSRGTASREADRIKGTRTGWAKPATPAKTTWRSGPLPVPAVGLAAGVWAAVVGVVITIVLTLIVWIFAAGESASDTAMRVGADIWLAAHGTPFRVGSSVWTLMPWAWIVFPGVTLWAAGRWVAHRAAIAFLKSAAVAAGTLAAGYSVIALIASLFGTMSGAGAMPMRALVHTFVIAFLVSGAAILWRARLGKDLALRAWHIARPAAGALAALTIGACAVLVVALVASYPAINATLEDVRPGIVGGIALLIGWLGYLPASLFWALSYVVGAGIVVAGEPVTPLSPFGEQIDMLGLNLVPTTSQPAWLLGILIPIAAGVVLGRLAGPAASNRQWLVDRVLALAVVLIAIDIWWFISIGRLGEGRLELLGPSPLVIPVLMVAMVLGIAGDVGLRWGWRRWRAHRAASGTTKPPGTGKRWTLRRRADTAAQQQAEDVEQVPDDEDVSATS